MGHKILVSPHRECADFRTGGEEFGCFSADDIEVSRFCAHLVADVCQLDDLTFRERAAQAGDGVDAAQRARERRLVERFREQIVANEHSHLVAEGGVG